MDDFERYGDYNEIDEPPKKSSVLLIIKIAVIAICALVVGFLIFRLFIFNHSPKTMRELYFTETLTEYYKETNGKIGAMTQKLRTPYDDAEDGNFFCDNLIVIPGCGEVQVSLKFNKSLGDTLKEKYGISDFDPNNEAQFSFRLWRDGEDADDPGCEVGTLTACIWENYTMYRHCKLVFDGVSFDGDESRGAAEWIRLEVFIDGMEKDEPFMILIYENNSSFSKFDSYKPSKGERPE